MLPRHPASRTRTAAFPLALLGLALLVAGGASADVLLIERAQSEAAVALPERGMRMAAVEARFGAPTEKRAPVGGGHPQRPPITRWIYPEFSVYFEHVHVVDAVLNRASPQESGPKPVH